MNLTEVYELFNENNNIGKINKNHIFLMEDEQQNPSQVENQDGGDRKIGDEQVAQIAQGLQNNSISEDEIQQALESGQMTDADIQAIQQAMQAQNPEDVSPEEKEKMFQQEISSISENFMRINFYNRIIDLEKKIETIINNTSKTDLINKLEHVKNYLDILLSLVYNIDVNILNRLYISLELKVTEYVKESLGLDTKDEKLTQMKLKMEEIKNNLKLKYTPENLINYFKQYLNNEMDSEDKSNFEEDLKKLTNFGLYKEGDLIEAQKQAQDELNQEQQEQSQDQEQGNDKVEQAAQAIISGQASMEELDKMKKSGDIDEDTYNQIKEKVDQNQGKDNDQDQSQVQPEQDDDQSKSVKKNKNDMIEDPRFDEDEDEDEEDKDTSEEIDQIAQMVLEGKLSADELINKLKSGELSAETFEAITNKIAELKANK